MDFLAPMSGLIAAWVAFPLLVLSHMLKLRRQPVALGSTLLWRQAAQDLEANAPLRLPRLSFGLLLQALALGCLCLSLARPLGSGAAPAQRLTLLLDTSASMGATDGGPNGQTRLDAALFAARKLLDRTPAEASVSVISFAADATLLTPPLAGPAAARSALADVQQTDQPGDVSAALQLAAAQAGAGAGALRVVLFNDGGSSSKPAHSAPELPSGTELLAVLVGPSPGGSLHNTGIAALRAVRDRGAPRTVRVFARAVNASAHRTKAALTLLVDGAPSLAASVSLPGATAAGPGAADATFRLAVDGAALLTAQLRGGDALSADDAAHVLVPAATPLRATVVSSSAAGPFLRAGLKAVGASVQTASPGVFASPQSSPRDAPGVFVLDGASPDGAPIAPCLLFGVAPAGAGVRVVTNSARTGSVRLASWRRTDPVLRHAGMDQVLVSAGHTLAFDGPNAGAWTELAWAPAPGGSIAPVLASGASPNGTPLIVAAFPADASNWPLLAESFPVFLRNAIDSLTASAQGRFHGAAASYTTTDAVTVPPAEGAQELLLDGPTSRTAPVPSGNGARPVSLGRLPRAGVYTVRNGAPGAQALAVNLTNATESWLQTSSTPFPPTVSVAASGGVSAASAAPLWRWFVLAALALASVEWVLHALHARR